MGNTDREVSVNNGMERGSLVCPLGNMRKGGREGVVQINSPGLCTIKPRTLFASF